MKNISYRYLLLTLCFFCCCGLFAQRIASARLVDYITSTAIDAAQTRAVLLRPDSTFVDSLWVNSYVVNGRKTTSLDMLPKEEGDFLIRIENPDYQTLYHPVHIKFYAREREINLGRIGLKRARREEPVHDVKGEATATGTKLKFYFDKDTLVYNASTFITQEGFVLSDILHKMPGLTLEEDGEIYSNGRRVETMLLNGKDFFNNDRETLLENLPAFMVKNVKIFEKEKDSTATFRRERELEGLVMDVRLKPQYHSVIIGNVDVAGGTDNHYYGRLFAMQVHDLHRWSVYAGANNVNKNEDVNRNGQFFNMDNGWGRKDFYTAGLNYNVDDRLGRYTHEGNLRVQGSRERTEMNQIMQAFYADGDTYTYNTLRNRQRAFSLKTGHTLSFFQSKPYSFELKPALTYVHSKTSQRQAMATFSRSVRHILGDSWVDSLWANTFSDSLQRAAVNHMTYDADASSSVKNVQLEVTKTLAVPHTSDEMSFLLGGYYAHTGGDETSRRAIDTYYSAAGRPTAVTSLTNQRRDNSTKQWRWVAEAGYLYRFNEKHSLKGTLHYERENTSTNDVLYNLQDTLRVIDPDNSKWFDMLGDTYRAEATYSFSKEAYNLNVIVPFNVRRNRLNFFQENNDAVKKMSLARPDFKLTLSSWQRSQTGCNFNIDYSMENALPSLIYLVDQKNDANPLLVYYGNAHLKPSTTHKVNAQIHLAPSMRHNHSLMVSYNYMHNLVTNAFTYDRQTGVYSYTPRNVDGNQSVYVRLQNAGFLTAKYNHKLTNAFTFNYVKSVDFSGTTERETAAQSTVRNYKFGEELTYNFNTVNTKVRGALTPYANYTYSTSDRPGFEALHAWEYGARVQLVAELPWQLRLSTEAGLLCRRGYNSDEMNDEEVIWNATLSKSFKHGISLMLEGFDLLGQYKNIVRVVSAQSRMETRYNHLRRYAMLHFVWQFNKQKHG